jgi:hypothetical protein
MSRSSVAAIEKTFSRHGAGRDIPAGRSEAISWARLS